MAYVKTNWVDNETPITAENLNKIEQGIEYASENGNIVDTFNVTDKTTNAPSIRAVEDKLSYSLEEKHIGYWIDGKPLYRKVIQGVTGGASVTTLYDIAENIKVVDFRGQIDYPSEKLLLPISYTNRNAPIYSYINASSTMVKLGIIVPANEFKDKNFFAIIEYTKTTD